MCRGWIEDARAYQSAVSCSRNDQQMCVGQALINLNVVFGANDVVVCTNEKRCGRVNSRPDLPLPQLVISTQIHFRHSRFHLGGVERSSRTAAATALGASCGTLWPIT